MVNAKLRAVSRPPAVKSRPFESLDFPAFLFLLPGRNSLHRKVQGSQGSLAMEGRQGLLEALSKGDPGYSQLYLLGPEIVPYLLQNI